MEKKQILILTSRGLSNYLIQEITDLGFTIISSNPYGAKIEGTFNDIMRLNLLLRTAHHILCLVKTFSCANPDELYQQIQEIPWENIIDVNGYLSVFSQVDNPTIRDSRFPNLKCKDAIVDRIFKINGRRPDSGNMRDKTVIYLYWKENTASIYIDTSGETLAKRGWRINPYQAPLQETLAAGILMAAGYNGQTNLINPMCGSGTLAIEAAFIALNRPASLLRTNFGFMHVKEFDPAAWKKIYHQAKNQEKQTIAAKIIATDINKQAINASLQNSRKAGVDKFIEFVKCDFRETPLTQKPGMIILNPEYGLRLKEADNLEILYKNIGDFFKQKCAGLTGYVFTGNLNLGKKIGLKTKRKIPFYSSQLECRLYEYNLY